jgi:arylsulfatase A-like enzyme
LLIISDDAGYADVGVHGVQDYSTPNIDSIADNGILFTDGYVPGPVCSPSRAGMMTGRYPAAFGYEFNPIHYFEEYGLPVTETALTEVMQGLGYRVGHIGKWQLGHQEQYWPTNRGVDYFYGFPHGSGGHFAAHPDDETVHPARKLWINNEMSWTPLYLPDAYAVEACDFIERSSKRPFFLTVSYSEPHSPAEATEGYLDAVGYIEDPDRRVYAAMMVAMDHSIGQVLDCLETNGLYENTMVIFINDNGGASDVAADNSPLYGRKSTLHEGGIRVPFMMQWPERLPAGMVYESPVCGTDIFPTCITAARGTPPGTEHLDGVDLVPYLCGDRFDPPHESLLWMYMNGCAIRAGGWKLHINEYHQFERLFHLPTDICEESDLSLRYLRVLRELRERLAVWAETLPLPLWPV